MIDKIDFSVPPGTSKMSHSDKRSIASDKEMSRAMRTPSILVVSSVPAAILISK